jgi:hypothetical protein
MKPSNLLLTLTFFLTLTQITPLTQHPIKTLTLALKPGTQSQPTPNLTTLPQKIPTDLKNLSANSGIVQVIAPAKNSHKKEPTKASIDKDSIIGTQTYDQIAHILMREIKKVSISESDENGLNAQHPPIPVSQDQAYAQSMLLNSLMKSVMDYLKTTKISTNYKGDNL